MAEIKDVYSLEFNSPQFQGEINSAIQSIDELNNAMAQGVDVADDLESAQANLVNVLNTEAKGVGQLNQKRDTLVKTAYRKITNNHGTCVLTGTGLTFGGSLVRTEATGYGAVYFSEEMLKTKKETIKGKTAIGSGSGNVAQYAAQKLIQLGAKVVTLSDSDGYIYDPAGIDDEKLAYVLELKNVKRGRISEYAEKFKGVTYEVKKTPWGVKGDLAYPCATQNELNDKDAKKLVDNGVKAVTEGANMPCTLEAIKVLQDAGVLYAPGKASNAGGVATSGLEMVQNSQRFRAFQAKAYRL